MDAMGINAIFSLGRSAIERIWQDPNKRAEEMRKLEELRQRGNLETLSLHVQMMIGQLEVNKIEASHKSLFVAGWRPFVGWTCAAIFAWNYIGVYLIELFIVAFASEIKLPERFDMSEVLPVLLGMLGLGVMRSYDKMRGIQTDSIRTKK